MQQLAALIIAATAASISGCACPDSHPYCWPADNWCYASANSSDYSPACGGTCAAADLQDLFASPPPLVGPSSPPCSSPPSPSPAPACMCPALYPTCGSSDKKCWGWFESWG
eukprot:4854596-Prymnesium_polylepis.1